MAINGQPMTRKEIVETLMTMLAERRTEGSTELNFSGLATDDDTTTVGDLIDQWAAMTAKANALKRARAPRQVMRTGSACCGDEVRNGTCMGCGNEVR